jgi:hypothetical protein
MYILPSFLYKILESRVGRFVAYVLLFAAIFAFIALFIFHLESSAGN